MSDEEVEKDLDTAGAAIQTFAPGGFWGLAMGGALALLALTAGASGVRGDADGPPDE